MIRKRLGIAILAVWMLAGCSSSAKEESAPEPKTIQLTVWGPEHTLTHLQEKADAFSSEHSAEDLQIVIEAEAAETIRDTVLTDVAGAADVILVPAGEADVLTDAKALQPFEDGSYYLRPAETFEEELVIAVTADTREPEWAVRLAEAFGN